MSNYNRRCCTRLQLAARILMPGAVEFAGALVQTKAYAAVSSRLTQGAVHRNGSVGTLPHTRQAGGGGALASMLRLLGGCHARGGGAEAAEARGPPYRPVSCEER